MPQPEKTITTLLSLICVLLGTSNYRTALAATLPEDQTKAVILAYHRIGEDAYPGSNLRIDQFIEHIQDIERGEYTVMALPAIIDALRTGSPLPENTIAITFNGGYKSALNNAFPVLMEKKIPFTVFYAADKAQSGQGEYMDWHDLRKLARSPHVTLATLPYSYAHIAHLPREEMLAALNKARQYHREHFSQETRYLAYPFGEYNAQLQDLAQTQGFEAAFGLQSGPAHSASDIYALPRFSMTEDYGDIDRFRLISNALPLPVSDLIPEDPALKSDTLKIGFTLPDAMTGQPNCYFSGYGKPQLEKIGQRLEIRPTQTQAPLIQNDTRLRLNCTLAQNSEDDTPHWRWFGMLYHRAPIQAPDAPRQPPE